jgi:hypothetical protein
MAKSPAQEAKAAGLSLSVEEGRRAEAMSRETVEMLRYELERKRDPTRNPARSNTITIALRDAEELLAALDERDALKKRIEKARLHVQDAAAEFKKRKSGDYNHYYVETRLADVIVDLATASEPQGSRPKMRSPMRPFPGDSE